MNIILKIHDETYEAESEEAAILIAKNKARRHNDIVYIFKRLSDVNACAPLMAVFHKPRNKKAIFMREESNDEGEKYLYEMSELTALQILRNRTFY